MPKLATAAMRRRKPVGGTNKHGFVINTGSATAAMLESLLTKTAKQELK